MAFSFSFIDSSVSVIQNFKFAPDNQCKNSLFPGPEE